MTNVQMLRIVICSALLLSAFPASAQTTYPTRTVTLVVVTGPGGGTVFVFNHSVITEKSRQSANYLAPNVSAQINLRLVLTTQMQTILCVLSPDWGDSVRPSTESGDPGLFDM